MPSDNWDRLQSLFGSAVDLPPDEQERFLDAACGEDLELLADIRSLLASDLKGGEAISSAVGEEASLILDAETPVGSRLGAWKVMKEIGRGGMGTVYLAVRDDDQYRKRVAIKVVKRGMDTDEVLSRFRSERQILANLDHAYIARLLDAGTTGEGRPFLVMDYVDGQPVGEFCRERGLGPKAICDLFLRILEAVAHAHRNLVVHRDLKPGNILVTAEGIPKLLDFGVAKLLREGADAGATVAAVRTYTPEYASPEQVRGQAVTTATDIYSLGAVLHELLTGERAQKIASSDHAEVERVVCETEVRRPSLVRKGIDSDLDNIVLMAMRKAPERRYRSADQMAEDIRRYLHGRPIAARRDSFVYRAGKFIGRNRLAVTAAALVFASLVAGVAASLYQARLAVAARRVAETQRQVAERERARAEAGFRQAEAARSAESRQRLEADRQRDEANRERGLADRRLGQLLDIADKTLFGIHDVVARLPGATEARKTLARTTLDYLESIQKQNGLDDRLRLSLAAGYSRIAAILGDDAHPSLGDFEGARLSYLKAEALMAPLYARRKNDPEVILRWLGIERALAEISRTHLQRDDGIRMYLVLVPVAHRLAALLPSDRNALKQEADIEGALSFSIQPVDGPLSLVHADRQIEIISGLVDRFPEDRDLKQELGAALAAAAVAMDDLADPEKAVEYFERSIRIREQFLELEPHNALVQRNLLVVYGNYATRLGVPWSSNLGRFAEARRYCEKSVALARALADADPQDKTARFDLAEFLGRLGEIQPDPDQVPESLKSLEEALSILEPISRDDPTSWDVAIQVALVRAYAAFRLQSLGRLADSAESFRKSLTSLEATISADPDQPEGTRVSMIAEEGLAEIYALQGDRAAAYSSAHHAVDRAEKFSASRPDALYRQGYLGEAYFELAWVERTLGDWDRAATSAERAASIWGSITHKGVLSIIRQARERMEVLVREIAARRASH